MIKKSYLFLIPAIFLLLISSINASTLRLSNNKFIAYSEFGKGLPLVLIHAFPTDQRVWQPQQEELKDYFHIITLDLWGFGQSSDTDGNAITMAEYADEVKQLMDYLQIDKAIIAGESMGGYIALAFLEQYPSQSLGLVLSNTQSIEDTAATKAAREKTALDVLENGTGNLIQGFMTKALSANASEQTRAYLYHLLTQQKSTGIASALRGMALRKPTTDILANTSLPILIIAGNLDQVIPIQQSIEMHSLAKNSHLVLIPTAGHLSSLEEPRQWNQAVINMFIK